MVWKGQGKPAACLLPWRHGADVGEKGVFRQKRLTTWLTMNSFWVSLTSKGPTSLLPHLGLEV